ncbi:hypothetical protein FDUTEX481_08814 [Tolypothrix sp. PCC 7601]|nr:hypothetical protein FDUTEX481_08814 [Tolypothrix sp. PCC 7601]
MRYAIANASYVNFKIKYESDIGIADVCHKKYGFCSKNQLIKVTG